MIVLVILLRRRISVCFDDLLRHFEVLLRQRLSYLMNGCNVLAVTSSTNPRYVYDRSGLLTLYTRVAQPSPAVVERVRSLGLWAVCRLWRTRHCLYLGHYRGCRAGRQRRPLPMLRCVANGAVVIVGNRPAARPAAAAGRLPSSLINVHTDRHSTPPDIKLTFGCLNILSVTNKLDDLLEVRRDLSLGVMFLVETWHDADSVAFRRLRSDGLQVVDRLRTRSVADTLSTNHGGVAAVAVSGVQLTAVDLGVQPDTFEMLCVRVVSGLLSCIAVVVYRTGPMSAAFFAELSDVLDRVTTYVDPILVVGDVNIHLQDNDDPYARQFTELLAAHGLGCRVSLPTHDMGGLLDVVVTRDDLPLPTVDVLDVGLSDHRLLCWSAQLARPCPVYMSTTSWPWRRLDADTFCDAVQSSSLCHPDVWSQLDIGALAQLYDDELTAILDRLIPVRTVRCRRRPSDPWFDEDYRAAKRHTRQLERAARRADPANADAVAATTAAWTSQRRAYGALLCQKREAFWQTKVDAERLSLRQLWQSIDVLLGRGRV